jgi:hypothetical protein
MSLGRRPLRAAKPPSVDAAAQAQEAHMAEAAKTTRLRALRLAKETADRDAKKAAATQVLGTQRLRIRVRSRSPT